MAPSLHSFADVSPPDGLLTGFRLLASLPRAAQQNLWHLIESELAGTPEDVHRELVDGYAGRFEANPAHVLAAAHACAYLLRRASAAGLEIGALMADVGQLAGGNRAVSELLVSRYEAVRDELRLQVLEDSLADHGNVLVGFDWRIDQVRRSNHGAQIDAPVVLLNLKYRRGTQHGELPLQLTPSAVASLKAFWTRFEAE